MNIDLEKVLFEKLLQPDYRDKTILEEQLANVIVVNRTITKGYASILLRSTCKHRLSYRERVPITMLAHVTDEKGNRPIQFLLHVINGFVHELEIFDAAGFDIDNYESIPLDNLSYQIDDG